MAMISCGPFLLGHGFARACAEYQAFQQGIAGQSISTVDAGSRRLARRIQPGNAGAPLEVSALLSSPAVLPTGAEGMLMVACR